MVVTVLFYRKVLYYMYLMQVCKDYCNMQQLVW